jgi:hypothetical protein
MITISIYSRDIDPISTKPSQFQMKNKTNKQTNKNLQQFCSTRVKPLANLAARWSYSSLDTFRKQNLKIISVRLADLWSCVRGPIPVQTSSRKKKKKKPKIVFKLKPLQMNRVVHARERDISLSSPFRAPYHFLSKVVARRKTRNWHRNTYLSSLSACIIPRFPRGPFRIIYNYY